MSVPELGTTARPKTTRRRVLAFAALFVAAIVGSVLVWRASTLSGLPDIGDPFDVAEYAMQNVPDERNAFVLYRQALAKFKRPTSPIRGMNWGQLDSSQREWLAAAKQSIDVWRLATERPDSLFIPIGEMRIGTPLDALNRIRDIADAATLEGTRLEALGDVAGAWNYYRAVLKSSRHYGRHGSVLEWDIGALMHGVIAVRMKAWASLPNVDATRLREALKDVQAIDASRSLPSQVLKYEYAIILKFLANPDEFLTEFAPNIVSDTAPKWRGLRTRGLFIRKFLTRDPERSRRVARLVLANWLAHCDRPLAEQPPVSQGNLWLYDTKPVDRPSASPIDVAELRGWYDSTLLLKAYFPATHLQFFANQRRNQAKLVIHLASELYRREHGVPPDSPDVLVGTYLDKLPEGHP
jgi:hypothetical protein